MTVAIEKEWPQESNCIVSPRCIHCPLSACRFDDVRPFQAWLAQRGMPRTIIGDAEADLEAARLGITKRSVYRRLAKARGTEPPV